MPASVYLLKTNILLHLIRGRRVGAFIEAMKRSEGIERFGERIGGKSCK